LNRAPAQRVPQFLPKEVPFGTHRIPAQTCRQSTVE
jgi:hypothetical protein